MAQEPQDEVVEPESDLAQEPPPVPPMPLQPQRVQAPQPQPQPVEGGKLVTVERTEKTRFERPLGAVAPDLTLPNRGRSTPAHRETAASRSDREFLDDLMAKPESTDYQCRIFRYLPTHDGRGRAVPGGHVHDAPVLYYDALRDEIARSWGGGEYRVVVYDGQGSPMDGGRSINISIPVTQMAPKLEKYEGVQAQQTPSGNGKSSPDDDESMMLRERRRMAREEAEIAAIEERKFAAEQRVRKAKMQADLDELQMAKMRKDLQGDQPKSGIEAVLTQMLTQTAQDRKDLEVRLQADRQVAEARAEADRREARERAEKDRTEALARADADRKMFMEALQKLGEAVARPAPDTGLKDVLVAMQNNAGQMQQQTTQLIAGLVPALKQQPDSSMKEVLVAMQTNATQMQQQTTQLLSTVLPAIAQRPDTGAQHLFEAMKANSEMVMRASQKDSTSQQQLINSLIGMMASRSTGEMTPELVMKLMDLGERRVERTVQLVQTIGGLSGGGGEAPESPEESYDPKLGFLGNAGKAIFYGLRKLPELAAQNPQLMALVMKLFGTPKPSENDMAVTAARMEREYQGLGQALPPPVATQLPMPQPAPQPVMMPQAAPPQMVPPPVAPQQRVLTPPPVPPPSVAQQSAQPARPQPQSDVVAELEGEAGGVDLGGEVPGVPQEAVEAEPEVDLEAQAEERLRESVTATIEIAVTDTIDKVAKREWPEDATDHWPLAFKQAVVNAPEDRFRIALIQSKCHPELWKKLIDLVTARVDQPIEIQQAKQAELIQFYRDLARFVELNKVEVTRPPAPPPPPATAPPQAAAPAPVQNTAAPAPVQNTAAPAPVQNTAAPTPAQNITTTSSSPGAVIAATAPAASETQTVAAGESVVSQTSPGSVAPPAPPATN